MVGRRIPLRIWCVLLHVALFAAVLVTSQADGDARKAESSDIDSTLNDLHAVEKKYLGAAARNGWLTKLTGSRQKNSDKNEGTEKDDSVDGSTNGHWMEEKRHIGAFLRAHGRPESAGAKSPRRAFEDEKNDSGSESSEASSTVKRNVAALARLGRLNAVRFGQYQPMGYGGKKRITVYEDTQNDGRVEEASDVPQDSNECQGDDDDVQANTEDNYIRPNWAQSQNKRYIAALARSGRLPAWHSERMWLGGVQDTPRAYWLRFRSGARSFAGKRHNVEVARRYSQEGRQNCRKPERANRTDGDSTAQKRNLAMLARQGKLPYRA